MEHMTTPNEDDGELRAMLEEGVMLTLDLAMEVLDAMERLRIEMAQWSVWVKHADGRLEPSVRHEGAVGALEDPAATFAWTRLFMHRAQMQHKEDPESPGSILAFFIQGRMDGAESARAGDP